MNNVPQKSVEELLTDALSSDMNLLRQTETALSALANQNLCVFLTNLGNILYDETKDIKLRQMSAILFKNILVRSDANIQTYLKIPPKEKSEIRTSVLGSLASNSKEIRTIASTLVAKICKIEKPVESNWPELLKSLTQNCFNENLTLKLSAIETLGFVCEELTLKDISTQTLHDILNSLVGNIKKQFDNLEVVQYSLKAFTYAIKLSESFFAGQEERDIIIQSIFNVIKTYQNNDFILEKVAMLFIEIFSRSNYYDYMENYMTQIFEFSLYLIKNKCKSNEKLSLLGLEILCSLGDEEEKRDPFLTNTPNNSGAVFPNEPKTKLPSKKYFNKISTDLQKMIIEYVNVNNIDETETEWNLSKGFLYLLGILVKVSDNHTTKEFFKQLENQIRQSDNDPKMRCTCWHLLSSTVDGTARDASKESAYKLVMTCLTKILNDIKPQSDRQLQNSASFLLKRATKLFPRLIDTSMLNTFFDILLSSVRQATSSTGINICHCIVNVIKAYGDLETKKGSSHLSPFFEKILQSLSMSAEEELMENKDEFGKLSLERITTIGALINYSSHDKQNVLNEILIKYLQQLETTHTNYAQIISKGIKEEKIKQLQDYYYTLLRIIFLKQQKPISQQVGQNIWILTDQIFKIRKTVFVEANIAMGALADNMKKDFSVIFPNYYPYLEYSLKQFTEADLNKSGLVTLLSILRELGEGIFNKREEILKTILEVCNGQNVERKNKSLAICCLGELALSLGKNFSNYVNPIMILLFSACEIAMGVGMEMEEENMSFLKNIRYELIQTFTCISFALEDQVTLLVPHVPNIFKFFKAIVNDKILMEERTLLSMMNFIIDMISAFGMEMKPLCEREFLIAVITNLQSYGDEKIKEDISKAQNIFNELYSQ
ncbi:MAG: hypothetical protein MJ252_21060 [archaeon]|nr:hypothetical protein [archaeon]